MGIERNIIDKTQILELLTVILKLRPAILFSNKFLLDFFMTYCSTAPIFIPHIVFFVFFKTYNQSSNAAVSQTWYKN
jgi:hypothetical protein